MAGSVQVHVQISGLEDLQRKLTTLPIQLSKKIMRQALRYAVTPWLFGAQSLAHRFTGWMASQFTIRTSVRGDELEGTAKVGIKNKQNPARHQKHVPGAANELLWNEFGTIKMAAQPVLRPAFEAGKDAVLARFIEKVRELLGETFQ